MPPDGVGGMTGDSPSSSSIHLLELTLISAQDLFPSSRSLRTYAVTWLHPSYRLRTRLDASGHTDPTWNDKFLFRIDDLTLRSDTSAIQVDIYAARPRLIPGPDALLGTARAVLSTLRPSPSVRSAALQIRRPASLRPQGILNIALGIISDLPPYSALPSPAFAFRDLMLQKKKEGDGGAPLPPMVLDRSGSVAGKGEAESFLLEKKLKKWRSEIWATEDQIGWEKEERSPVDEEARSRRGRSWRPRAMSCFNLAGQYADQAEDGDDFSSTSSRSSCSQR